MMTYDTGTQRLFFVMKINFICCTPLESILMCKLFGLTQTPFTVSDIFKVKSGLLNHIRQNFTPKVISIDIFTPHCQIGHPLQ